MFCSNKYCIDDARIFDVLTEEMNSWPLVVRELIGYGTTATFFFPNLTVVWLVFCYWSFVPHVSAFLLLCSLFEGCARNIPFPPFSSTLGTGNGNTTKAIGLISKTTILHVHHAFLYISLRHCTTTTWKCLISRWQRKYTSDDEVSSLFLNLNMVLRNLPLGGLTYIWQS